MTDYNELYTAAVEDASKEGEFNIYDDKVADWALRIIKGETEEANRLIALADEQIAELNDKKDAIEDRLEHRIGFLKNKLNLYFRTVPHKETETQETYKLLSGKLVMKKATTRINHDDEAILGWAKENAAEYIKTKESLDWSTLKKDLDFTDDGVVLGITGEVIPGVTIENVPESFDVKL